MLAGRSELSEGQTEILLGSGWWVGWADGEGRMDFCRLGALRMCMLQPFGGFFLEAVHLAGFSRNLMNSA